jgi:hypothetical protein
VTLTLFCHHIRTEMEFLNSVGLGTEEDSLCSLTGPVQKNIARICIRLWSPGIDFEESCQSG